MLRALPQELRAPAYRNASAFDVSVLSAAAFRSARLRGARMPVSLLYGVIQLPWWVYVSLTFAMVQIMFLGVTLYLHRDQSHGGLVLHPILRHFFRFWLWFCSGTVTREWVAVHRRHHAFADRSGDPHSPVVFGLRRVVLQGYELYVAAARDPKILANYGRGTPDDWLERNLYSRFPKVGISLFVGLQLILFGVPAVTMLAVQLVAQPFFAGGIINGFGHRVGYRSFELPTAATNIVPWGVLIAGEELHNNHHAFPSSPRFSVQRWEIRMHVLRDYRRCVVRPVFRELMKQESPARLAHRSPR